MIVRYSKFTHANPEEAKPPCPTISVSRDQTAKVQRVIPAEEPTLAAMAENFAGAVSRWVESGMQVVTKEEYDRRAAICDACKFWDGKARMGLGKCSAPGCGCTRLKRWLATERCPLKPPKW